MKITRDEVRYLLNQGLNKAQIAKKLNTSYNNIHSKVKGMIRRGEWSPKYSTQNHLPTPVSNFNISNSSQINGPTYIGTLLCFPANQFNVATSDGTTFILKKVGA
jgi:hypothetical protein